MHAIEVTRFRPWTDVDALTVFKLALVPTIVLDDIDRTIRFEEYRAAGAARGFDGTALFFGDVERTAPFDRTSVIPDALQKSLARQDDRGWRSQSVHRLDAQTSKLARGLMARVRSAPLAAGLLLPRESADRGSNAWVVSGRFTASGRPLLASDPHFALTQPSTFYMMHLEASAAGIDFIGLGLPGIPYLVVGNNQHLAFGFTAGNIDVVDIYRETVVPDPGSPSGLSTKYRGTFEPIVKLPQTFRINTPGDGSADNLAVASGPGIPAEVLIVPRRNDGPILQFDAETGVALSFQWTGSSGTRELEAFRGFNRARSMADVDPSARILRQRLPEHGGGRHQGQHRLFPHGGSAAPRGSAGRGHRRCAADVHPQRRGRQRVDSGDAAMTRHARCRSRSCPRPRCRA